MQSSSATSQKILPVLSISSKKNNTEYSSRRQLLSRCASVPSSRILPKIQIQTQSSSSLLVDRVSLSHHSEKHSLIPISQGSNIMTPYTTVSNIWETPTRGPVSFTPTSSHILSQPSDPKYDLVIGNPPYFVMKKDAVAPCYLEYFDGRPNIFILFIIRSLSLLAPNGILCFVLPKNFLNCIYYDNTRKYISNKFTIVDIFDTGGAYLETQQDTVVLVVRNSQPEDPKLSNI